MKGKFRIKLWVAAIAAILSLTTAAYAALPLLPKGEDFQFRLNTLMSNLNAAAQGSLVYFSAADTPNDLAPPATDNYVLLYDTDADTPYWGASTSAAGTWTDTAIPFATATDTLGQDATNFSFADATNTLALGGGATDGGEIRFKEDSDNGTNYVGFQAAATIAANAVFELWDAALVAGDLLVADGANNLGVLPKNTRPLMVVGNTGASNVPAYRPVKGLLYSSLTASTAHDGTTAAETTVMPATAEGTAATDIATANMLAGAVFDYKVWVDATGDADGDETLTVNVYFGAQLVGTTGAVAVDGATDFIVTGTVNLEAAGASVAGNYFSVNNTYPGVSTSSAATFATFDTTAVQAFAVKLDWGGTTDAADTATVELVTLELVNFD